MAELIDGKVLKDKVLTQLKKKIKEAKIKPILAIVLVGNNEASERYVRQKQKAAEEIGAQVNLLSFPNNVSEKDLITVISRLNQDPSINGIVIQLPLPKHLNQEKVTQVVEPNKDVDGLVSNSHFSPATPVGIMQLLKEYKVSLEGKTAVVIGQSRLVGAPLSKMLQEAGSKVVPIDINTPPPIDPLVARGDIVVAAVGTPGLIKASMVKEGVVVIDVGINKDPKTGKLVGDVLFEEVSKKASLITPVPGGVGPMTVAALMSNLVNASILDK